MGTPLVVGLTGGVASGKSTVATLLAALGADIIDTDVISAELTGPDGHACAAIRTRFGSAYVREDGGLDRARMRALVFDDPLARAALESILHPLIHERTLARVSATTAPLAVLVIPLLFETMSYRDQLAEVAVVDTSENRQMERLCCRPGLTPQIAGAIIASQLPRALRLQLADVVICNTYTMGELQVQVQALHERWQRLRTKPRP